MPTLPLFHPPAHANAWHDVFAPGGYEWWRFDAEDATGANQVVVTFFQGEPLARDYRRAHDRYRAAPTRAQPPIPTDWPGIGVLILRDRRVVYQQVHRFAAGQFSASRESLSVAIGGNTIQRPSASEVRAHVDLPGCRLRMTMQLIARPAIEERLLVDHARARHRWVLAAPLCRAETTIELTGETLAIQQGLGCHDHAWGTAPLHQAARRLFLARLLREDRAVFLRIAQPTERSRAQDIALIEVAPDGTLAERSITAAAVEWGHRGRIRPRRPQSLIADSLSLQNPRDLARARGWTRLAYDLAAGPATGIAIADVVEF